MWCDMRTSSKFLDSTRFGLVFFCGVDRMNIQAAVTPTALYVAKEVHNMRALRLLSP